ncbi:MAG: hypothetical protein K8R88_01410 [Armatimonadetes bacterium]|nr:hypothetical protein [Armatimonadota bacterium]
MAEKPILFSAPMIAALLAGKKTQTRRLVNPSNMVSGGAIKLGFHLVDFDRATNENGSYLKVPFAHPVDGWESDPEEDTRGRIGSRIQVGDLLWVKETFHPGIDALDAPYIYKADYPTGSPDSTHDTLEPWGKWKPSIFMSRWASRITLNVTGVKVERVQSISREDAAAEGICYLSEIGFDGQYKDRDGSMMNVIQKHRWPEENFGHLWMMINCYDSWNRNDWVFAYEFEVQNG